MSAKSSPAAKRGRATMGQAPADAPLRSLIKDVLASGPSGKKVLVIDVGGTSVKILASGQTEIRSFRSGPTLTPGRMVSGVKKLAADWMYEVMSIGYPGPVLGGRPTADPPNLGRGWIGFDFATAFGRPVKVVNDAAMQAMGSYKAAKCYFWALGRDSVPPSSSTERWSLWSSAIYRTRKALMRATLGALAWNVTARRSGAGV